MKPGVIMREEKLKELFNLMYEFMPLYHQTMGSIYKKDYDIEPKLNKNQQRAVFIIKKHERISPSALGICLDMQKGSLTTLIDSLERYDFVKRIGDKNDRRRQWIYLTKKGETYISILIEKFKAEFIGLFDNLNISDIVKLIENFKDIKFILKNINATGDVLCK